jgi:hypothetical protein
VRDHLLDIFESTYRELRPRAEIPPIFVKFHAYSNINNTIRLREGKLLVRISDMLEGAPEAVLRALAHILLAKMCRRPIEAQAAARYRRFVSGKDISRKAHLMRQIRGRKRVRAAQGHHYDLEAIFDDLNTRFFHGLLGRPRVGWSLNGARRLLGHYDPAHNAIIISRVFDHPAVPRYAVEYIVYHEMLHLKHPVKLRGSRRCVHSADFRAEEKLFPRLEEAQQFLRQM